MFGYQKCILKLPLLADSIVNLRSPILSVSHKRKEPPELTQDRILRQSEALSVLARHPIVRVRFSSDLPKSVLVKFPHSEGETIEAESSLLRNLLHRENVDIKIVENHSTLPVLQIQPLPFDDTSATNSISASKGKQLMLRTNIDDHMMSVKIRQASEFTAKGHEVTITVRLPSKQLRQLANSAAISEREKFAMTKRLYDASTQRFMDAFKDCSSKPAKLVLGNDLKEFTIILSGHR
ncbi:unnamed protein product [Mesocestoides corti]|nr:unnamed protein product [Mesocestoides corti]